MTGTYTDGGVIEFNGISLYRNRCARCGRHFPVAPAGRESVFTTLDNMIAALTTEVDTPARARS